MENSVEHSLAAEQLAVGYDQREIIHDLSVRIPTGKITVIVGANACGKSTLLKTLARLLKPSKGAVLLDGKSIQQVSTREVATKLGLLPQSPTAPEGITVADLVGRGRYPHQGWIRQWTKADDEAVAAAMISTDVLEIADRPIDELSGGQRQRVWIAMALAQETNILLLDEPTTFLDLTHQFEVLDLLVDLNKRDDRTIVLVLHDLNQACRFADHLIAMKDGDIVCEGDPREVITEQIVENVFGLAVKIVPDPVAGSPMVVPIGRHTTREPTPSAVQDTVPGAAPNPAARALAASALASNVCRPTNR
ncbi:cobalamin/Fe3+-siderophore ABC transporter ATP-binding protein [Kribbella sp. ALI-6-A]|uniref:ABC transporter ATP-binding protein n=1 Tax=Kribbella sp. ALI-6-A TaxID=1933817 RepID=UPI00097C97A5|nr:ABC transporter ATP-binding protein [Kribbella sp. ALI-6-A]ONI68188.1 cobalamin/Fe3+-siderophore ABC transporter ATP-binding protein [Kribbella sp. ALI-6-A]